MQWRFAFVASLLAWAGVAAGSAGAAGLACDGRQVTWEPRAPKQSSLFRIKLVDVPAGIALEGSAAGERLHFSTGSPAISLAAVPIDAGDSIPVIVRCVSGEGTDSAVLRVPTASGDYPMERLRVAPAFGRPPDPATAARIQRESQRAADMARAAHATPRLRGTGPSWRHGRHA